MGPSLLVLLDLRLGAAADQGWDVGPRIAGEWHQTVEDIGAERRSRGRGCSDVTELDRAGGRRRDSEWVGNLRVTVAAVLKRYRRSDHLKDKTVAEVWRVGEKMGSG